jgi:hypothetical protein
MSWMSTVAALSLALYFVLSVIEALSLEEMFGASFLRVTFGFFLMLRFLPQELRPQHLMILFLRPFF